MHIADQLELVALYYPHRISLGVVVTLGRHIQQADLASYRLGGEAIVASHHRDLDPSLVTLADRLRHLRPGRVVERDQAQQAELLLQLIGWGLLLCGLETALGHGDDAVAAASKIVVGGYCLGAARRTTAL